MKIKEALEYIPNCVLCNKEMRLCFSSFYSPVVYLNKTDDIVQNIKIDLKINVNTNEIISGQKFLNANFNSHFLKKNCATCRFTVTFLATSNIKSTFPEVTKNKEELYFFDNNKQVRIINKSLHDSSQLYYNKKWLNLPFSFNFETTNNLPAIKKRIKMVKLFQ